MLTELRRVRDHSPGAVAVRASTPGGGWADTTWDELCAAAEGAAARARRLDGGAPVVLAVDGTADSVATVLGLVDAGVDVVLLEELNSYLTDPNSPLAAVGATTLIGSAATVAAAAARYPTCLTYQQFRAPAEPDGPPPARPSQVLQLTSGSTGEPRVARQTLPGVMAAAVAYRQVFELTASDVILVSVPLPHSYGLAGMFTSLISGATLLTLPRFGIRPLLAGLDEGATVLLGTPMVYRLIAPVLAAHGRPPRLRTALSAGGPMDAGIARAAAGALGTEVRQIYGITEVGLVACVPQSLDRWPLGSVGRAAPGVRLRVEPVAEPDDGEPGPPTDAEGATTGRLFVRTPAMFEGYVGSDAPHLTPDGFYDTGDNVRLDAAGWLTVLGRKQGFVNVGGRKVSPRRVERLLLEHPAVRDAFVFGVHRDDGEQEIRAAVVLDPHTDLGEVLAYCRAGVLMPYEVPHHVHVLDWLPRTGMGKVDRRQVLAAIRQPNGATRT